MAIDHAPRTRRALLGAGIGAAAATVVSALPAAAVPPSVVIDQDNPSTGTTSITNSTTDFNTFVVTNTHAGVGIKGVSTAASGVVAESTSYIALEGVGHATNQPGILGWSTGNSTGIQGFSNDGTALFPAVRPNTGVHGVAAKDASAVGVRGDSSTGRGGLFSGGKAQLRLLPSTAATHPPTGSLGDLFVDKNKRLWFCKGGNTWKQLA